MLPTGGGAALRPERSIYAVAKLNGKTKMADGIEYHLVAVHMDDNVMARIANNTDMVWLFNDEVGNLLRQQPTETEHLPGKLRLDVAYFWLQLPKKGAIEISLGVVDPRTLNIRTRTQFALETAQESAASLQKVIDYQKELREKTGKLGDKNGLIVAELAASQRQLATRIDRELVDNPAQKAADELAAKNLAKALLSQDQTLKALGKKRQVYDAEVVRLKVPFDRFIDLEKVLNRVKQASADQRKIVSALPRQDDQFAGPSEQQQALIERAQSIKRQLAEIKPEVPGVLSASIATALAKMQNAQKRLAEKDREAASKEARQALMNLQQAETDLKRMLERRSMPQYIPVILDVAKMPEIQAATAEELSENLIKLTAKDKSSK